MGIRTDLHLQPIEGVDSFEMPEASYTMSKEQKLAIFEFIREVRFPDGYAANLAKCVSSDKGKLQGLKSHDCHILLQRIYRQACVDSCIMMNSWTRIYMRWLLNWEISLENFSAKH
jgi:hypothetical protein